MIHSNTASTEQNLRVFTNFVNAYISSFFFETEHQTMAVIQGTFKQQVSMLQIDSSATEGRF